MFHKELWRFLARKKNTVCIVPRSFAKTTAISKIGVVKRLCYGLESSILLLMSESLGSEVMADIRLELIINPIIRRLFGNLVPGGEDKGDGKAALIWRGKWLQLTNFCEVQTVSKGGMVRGRRPSLIIVDDPQELKDVANPRVAQEYISWYQTSLVNTKNPLDSCIIVLGTVISDDCLVQYLHNNAEKLGYESVFYEAIKNFKTKGFDGELLWPERWTKKMLIAKAKEIEMPNFLQEFQGIALPVAGRMVLNNHDAMKEIEPIGFYEKFTVFRDIEDPKYRYTTLHVGMDFADGKAGGDFQAVDFRNEAGQLVFQINTTMKQEQLVEAFDDLMNYIKKANPKITVAISPESNWFQVFEYASRSKWWYGLIRFEADYDLSKKKKSTDIGFRTGGTTKPVLMAVLQEYINAGAEFSKLQADQIRHYIRGKDGEMTGSGSWHDDLVISAALAFMSIKVGSPADLSNFFGKRKR